MVARHYGRFYSLGDLRKRCFITREGVSLLGIGDAAETVGFHALGVKITFEKLRREAPLPTIVHWYQRHFVVVYKISRGKVFVADPASGLLVYNEADFKKGWVSTLSGVSGEGIALLLQPTERFYEHEGSADRKGAQWRFVFHQMASNRKFLIQLALGLLAGSLIQLALPFLTQSVVDVGINTQNVHFIYLVLAGQVMLFIGKTTIEFIRRWLLLHISIRINISLVSRFLSKMFRLPMEFFEGKMIGDILRRIEDHSRIERFISTSSLNILFSFFNLLIFGLVLGIYNTKIFIFFFTMSVVYVAYVLLFMKKRGELDYKRFQENSYNQSNLIQTVEGMAEIKINNSETTKRWQWERIQARLFKVTESATRLQQWQDGGALFLNEIKNTAITVMAAIAVIDGELTIGMMLSVQYIIGQLNVPVNEFILFARDWQDAKISLQRVGEVHSQKDEDHHLSGNEQADFDVSGEDIVLKDVSFQYEGPRSPKVLDSVNLVIPKGKTTAIVGTSGSGKTTMLKILLKFYLPTGGKILLGDEDLANINSRLWRSQCGTVMQDGYIFSDTIAKNIALSDEEVDMKKVLRSADVANIREFIETLPLRYNTKIGGEGIGLSQGQKQRLLIARAVYKNPQIILFDEATSALDANNEKIILENLNAFMKEKTVVVIAHRLSTVKNADQIVVLEHGRIVEMGTHDQLSLAKGTYHSLVKNQLELGN
jgi:ATP-binding cassette subfamily B protein